MAGIAGSVAPVFRGEYSSTATYDFYHSVTLNNKLYFCKQDGTTGHTPTGATDDYWFLSIDGTFADASSLGGETASAWQTKLDNIQTTSRATLSTAGWYRVAEYKGTKLEDVSGVYANLCELIVRRTYATANNEEHIITLWSLYGKQEFSSYDKSNTQLFTKVRYVKDVSTYTAYLEVYYNANTANICDFTITKSYVNNIQYWQAITPTLTEETVDGVTVTTTYDIPANASPVTDLDLAGYLKNTGGNLDGSLIAYSDEAVDRYFRVRNSKRSVDVTAKSDGLFRIFDYTNNKSIINSTADGTNTFNGTATGNLPLTSTSQQTVTSPVKTPLVIKSTHESTDTFLGFKKNDNWLGFLGVDDEMNPVFGDNGGNTTHILHSGNSAKVVKSTSAPSDTAAIWVDTANKTVKVYLDGAWTQVG